MSALVVGLESVLIPIGQLLPAHVLTAIAASPTINEYSLPTANSAPQPVTKGPDNNVWFLEENTQKAGSVTPIGAFTEYALPTAGFYNDMVTGSDGNLWFTETSANKIAKLTTAGVVTEYTVPSANSNPDGITAGPDGNLWFVENSPSKVAKLTTSGTFTEYPVPTANSYPQRITVGSDSNLWFTESGGWCQGCSQPVSGSSGIGKVGRVTTAGAFTEYTIPTANGDPEHIVAGPAGVDSNLWFVEENINKVAKVSTSGVFTEYAVPTTSMFGGITAGSDGNVWFTENTASKVASISPSSGSITEYATPATNASPWRITVGADKNLWFPEGTASKIGQFVLAGPVGGVVSPQEDPAGSNPAEIHCRCSHSRRAFPVDTATGSFWHSFTDFAIPGRGIPITFSRTYSTVAAATNSPFGFGWSFSYSLTLTQNASTGVITIQQENGSQVSFTPSGGSYVAAPRVQATLVHNPDGTFTFTRRARQKFTFSAAGQLLKEQDLNGYVTSLTYNASNQLTAITDPAGRQLTLAWTGANITSVTDPNVTPNRQTTFAYTDGAGNLTSMTDVNGGKWQFTYDASHRLLTMADPRGTVTQNGYDTQGRVTSQTLDPTGLNRTTTFTYTGDYSSATGGSTTITDPKGNVEVEQYQYGERQSLTRGSGTAQAATWTYAYDPNTVGITAITDPNTHVTAMTYDSSGNLLTVTDALNRQTVNTYDSLNDLTTTTDPNAVKTTLTYDASGNLLSRSTPLTGTSQTQTTTYTYADTAHPGDVTSMVDPDSKTWSYTYDTYGNRASEADPVGEKSTYVYNADSWLTSSVSPKGNVAGCGCQSTYTTSYAHDAFGDLTTVTDPLGHQTTRHYDPDQNLDSFQDGDGNKTTYVYDRANEPTQVQRADGTTLTTDYNPDGTVLDQKDGKNDAILTYGYDALARVTSLTDALSNVTSYAYDGAGNRLTQQDPGGNCGATPKTGCTTFAYDAANQLKTITYSDGVTPNVTSIAYDSDGQRTGMTDGTGSSAWVWDSLHRLTSYTNGAGAQVQYAYNLRNLPTTITYPGNLNVTRGYDDARRLTSVQDWLSNTTSFGYDVNSNLTTETLPSGTQVVDAFTFDAANRLTAVADTKGNKTLFSATYTRDNANQLTSDSSAPNKTSSYRYTTLNQVCYAGSSTSSACSSPPPGATAYGYDAADNLTQIGTTSQAFNNADELCWTAGTASSCASPPSGATTYTYDARGNRTKITPSSGGATTLSYDQANRLTAYGSTATYAYNGDGLRMSKTVSGTTSQFLWDAAAAVPMLLKDGSTAYVYGPEGLPLEQINGSIVLWLHHDQLGSTRLATDSGGTSQATYTYDAYGNLTASTGTITNRLRFAGQYQDAESGLYYLRARYYDPSTGQFLSRDPAVATTREPYAYINDNPLNGVDPSGLLCWQFWDPSKCNNVLTNGMQRVSSSPERTWDLAFGTALVVGGVFFGTLAVAHIAGAIAAIPATEGLSLVTLAGVGVETLAAGTGISVGSLLLSKAFAPVGEPAPVPLPPALMGKPASTSTADPRSGTHGAC